MNAIVENCRTEEEQNKVLEVIKQSASLYWQMLDGMYVN
jgi:pyrroloquinoline quinone (PQQ) biosynthesis protein C